MLYGRGVTGAGAGTDETSGTRWARLRTGDPWVLVCALAALVVYLLRGFEDGLTRDMAVYAYGGQQVAEGVPPYAAILNRAGPLAHLVPGIGAWVAGQVGVDDLLGMRVLLMLVAVAAVATVYLVGRDLTRSRVAGLASAAALLCFEGFIRAAVQGPREKTTMVLFLSLALLAMVRQRWGTAGAMIALGTLTWQPVAFPAIAGVAVAALLGAQEGRVAALVRIAVGGLIPTIITVVAYAAVGRLQLFIDCFYLINARYTDQASLVDRPLPLWDNIRWGYGWSVWVMYLGALTVVVAAVVSLARRSRYEPRSASLVGLGVAAVVCLLWSLAAFNTWADAFFLLPVAAVGIGVLASLLRRWLPPRPVAAVTVAWALVATGFSAAYASTEGDHLLPLQRAEAELVMGVLPPGSELLCIESPAPLVLLQRRNAVRLQLFGNGLVDYVEDTWPGGVRGFARWIERRAPAALVVGKRHRWLRPVLRRSYVRVSEGNFLWFIRRDVPQDTIDQLTELLPPR
jgi:hypothetical protein